MAEHWLTRTQNIQMNGKKFHLHSNLYEFRAQVENRAATGDFQHCCMCDQQSLGSACAYVCMNIFKYLPGVCPGLFAVSMGAHILYVLFFPGLSELSFFW